MELTCNLLSDLRVAQLGPPLSDTFLFFIRYEIDRDLGFLFDATRYRSIFLASEMTFFRDLLLDNLFRGIF